jgi:hypothetical protein
MKLKLFLPPVDNTLTYVVTHHVSFCQELKWKRLFTFLHKINFMHKTCIVNPITFTFWQNYFHMQIIFYIRIFKLLTTSIWIRSKNLWWWYINTIINFFGHYPLSCVLFKNNILETGLGPEIGTSSINWAHLRRFYLRMETESSLRNVD